MNTLILKIQYDGTNYSGWQIQPNSVTIQSKIENVIFELTGYHVNLLGAGRTDAGVHADGQVIAFDLDWSHRPVDLVKALNGHLPSDISVKSAKLVSPDFNPRFDARERKYRYQVVFLPVRDPIHERYFWRVWPEPDHDSFQE